MSPLWRSMFGGPHTEPKDLISGIGENITHSSTQIDKDIAENGFQSQFYNLFKRIKHLRKSYTVW